MIVAIADRIVYTEQDSIDRDVFIRSSLAWPVSGLHPFHAVVILDQRDTVCYVAINVPDNNIRAGTVIVDERVRLANEQITINIYAQLNHYFVVVKNTSTFTINCIHTNFISPLTNHFHHLLLDGNKMAAVTVLSNESW